MSFKTFLLNDLPMTRTTKSDEQNPPGITRRTLLTRTGMGFGMLGLAGLLDSEGLLASVSSGSQRPHFSPRAKRVIHIFLNGGLSQVDSFDPKPMLTRYDGKQLPYRNPLTPFMTGHAFASPFKFLRSGRVRYRD